MPLFNHCSDSAVNTLVIHTSDLIQTMKNSKIAERLRVAREAAGLTQAQLADMCGISQGTIGNVESGLRGYGKSIVDIARALGVSPEFLSGEKDSGKNPSASSLTLVKATEQDGNDRFTVAIDQSIELLVLFQQSSDKGRELILDFARSAVEVDRARWVRSNKR